jgi:chromosome segregation ATPase
LEPDSYENPFKLPGDDQIFRMREEERRNKEEAKQKAATMKVWEKARKDVQSSSQRLQEMIGEEKLLKLTDVVKQESDNAKMMMPRRQEKENTADFVAKKREMFLVQMSLDTKREEIRKLEEKAQMKEEALQRSEQMLEEDAMRFDAFLKENDKKAHDAIKRAEEETKRKQEKNQEIKRLTQQIQAVNSEMSKHREALEDCMRYKNFLDMLTPPEWFEQHRRNREDKIARMKKEAFDIKHKDWEKVRRRLVEKHRKETEARREAAKERNKKAGNRHAVVEEEDEDEPEVKLVIPPAPRLEDEVRLVIVHLSCHIHRTIVISAESTIQTVTLSNPTRSLPPLASACVPHL